MLVRYLKVASADPLFALLASRRASLAYAAGEARAADSRANKGPRCSTVWIDGWLL